MTWVQAQREKEKKTKQDCKKDGHFNVISRFGENQQEEHMLRLHNHFNHLLSFDRIKSRM